MDRQARTRDTVLVKSIEMIAGATHCRGGWGDRGKDDRKQNTLAPIAWVSYENKLVFLTWTTHMNVQNIHGRIAEIAVIQAIGISIIAEMKQCLLENFQKLQKENHV